MILFATAFVFSAFVLFSPFVYAARTPPELIVYTYDAFAAEAGLGTKIKSHCDSKLGVSTRFIAFPSAGEALNQVALEGQETKADLVAGIDNSLLPRARALKYFNPIPSHLIEQVPRPLQFDNAGLFLPFDYGYVAILYDRSRGTEVRSDLTLEDFASNPSWRKKLVIEDPRTSSLGLAFLLWTHAVFNEEKIGPFWKKLSSQIRSVSPSWSSAYGMFLKKEADFVVSYTTSQAYQIAHEAKHTIHALPFSEGNFRQIEGVGIIKSSTRKEVAQRWLGCLLSLEVQKEIPTTQWMYPVREGTPLPKSFLALSTTRKPLSLETDLLIRSEKLWVKEWVAWLSGI